MTEFVVTLFLGWIAIALTAIAVNLNAVAVVLEKGAHEHGRATNSSDLNSEPAGEAMKTVSALPEQHPMMRVWNKWCATDEFKNALRWAIETKYDDGRSVSDVQREQHAKGAMWLAFTKGMEPAGDGRTCKCCDYGDCGKREPAGEEPKPLVQPTANIRGS